MYVICHRADQCEVLKRIQVKALDEFRGNESFHTKEPVGLDRALANDEGNTVVGWLELDNGYFFFTDKEMFEKVRDLFGVVTA